MDNRNSHSQTAPGASSTQPCLIPDSQGGSQTLPYRIGHLVATRRVQFERNKKNSDRGYRPLFGGQRRSATIAEHDGEQEDAASDVKICPFKNELVVAGQ
jgi:hypothetical protein